MNIAEQGKIVNILPPVDANGAARYSDYFKLKDYDHATIILQLGVTGAAVTVTVLESDDKDGTNKAAIAFNYYKEDTDAGDTLEARTAAEAAGFATSTNNNIVYVIEIDAAELSDGYPYVVVHLTDPTAATVVSAVAILTGARYGGVNAPTAIT